jgi:hypothetical protein
MVIDWKPGQNPRASLSSNEIFDVGSKRTIEIAQAVNEPALRVAISLRIMTPFRRPKYRTIHTPSKSRRKGPVVRKKGLPLSTQISVKREEMKLLASINSSAAGRQIDLSR